MGSTSEIGQCLQHSLSSDANIRISAELKISQLLANPGVHSYYHSVTVTGLTVERTRHIRCRIGLIAHNPSTGCRYSFATDE
ncbi:hypothetical protein HWV62_1841 [Athelia sp. TMB]|nr:hypothetical protein HWV62_1841 [Athelia sp. TMB]